MNNLLKILFVVFVVKPIVLIGLGLNVINRQNLPSKGPVILAANHNSHLDTLVLMSLFPISQLHKVRPVAAADYFLANRLVAWFSLNVLGIIPIDRASKKASGDDVLEECHRALSNGEILIIFPEGSRGRPEVMSRVRRGIYNLVKDHEGRKVMPVMMRGLGAALPKGTALFVPFNCDVVIGEALTSFESSNDFISVMQSNYEELEKHCITQAFED